MIVFFYDFPLMPKHIHHTLGFLSFTQVVFFTYRPRGITTIASTTRGAIPRTTLRATTVRDFPTTTFSRDPSTSTIFNRNNNNLTTTTTRDPTTTLFTIPAGSSNARQPPATVPDLNTILKGRDQEAEAQEEEKRRPKQLEEEEEEEDEDEEEENRGNNTDDDDEFAVEGIDEGLLR